MKAKASCRSRINMTPEEEVYMRSSSVFTTGQVSKLCRVAPRTVSKWVDAGKLPAYRIPGSNDRRIQRADLIAFIKENALPLGPLMDETALLLIFTVHPDIPVRVQEVLGPSWKIESVSTAIAAGQMLARLPDAAILDFAAGWQECCAIIPELKRMKHEPAIICILTEDGDPSRVPSGATTVCRYPFDPSVLVELQNQRKL